MSPAKAKSPRRPKGPPIDIEKMAAFSFDAIPSARDLGLDRKLWAKNSEADRVNAVIVGGILAKTKAELQESFKSSVGEDNGDLLFELIECLGTTITRANSAVKLCEAACARLFVLVASLAKAGVLS